MKKGFIFFLFFYILLASLNVRAQTELWSMAQNGGSDGKGSIFKMKLDGTGYLRPFDFTTSYAGANPYYTTLCQASNGKFYGLTSSGGNYSNGVLFSFDPNTNAYAKLFDFSGGTDGGLPNGSLVQASNGKLYGMTNAGGSTNFGVLFSFDPSTNTYSKLFDFNGSVNGAWPNGSLIQASNGKLYGMTSQGGNNGFGVLFNFDPTTNIYTKLLNFAGNTNGSGPEGNLIQALNGKLYGMTKFGGTSSNGVLFSFNPATNAYSKLLDFDGSAKGRYPDGSLLQASNGKLYGMTLQGGSNNFGVLFSIDTTGSNFTKFVDFAGSSNGANPYGSLMQASNGKLYGMTAAGGSSGSGYGTLFSFDPAVNTYSKLFDFVNANGSRPYGTLKAASNGKLYGMTYQGGSNNFGVLFSFDPAINTYAKLLDFNVSANGANPYASLVKASNGKLYGLTCNGGSGGYGVLFSLDPSLNTFTKLLDFNGSINGANPQSSLVQASNGKLYGMTYQGGANNYGVLFSFDPTTYIYSKLIDFSGSANGANPTGSLIKASNGKLYGMTSNGGTQGDGIVFSFDPSTNTFSKLVTFTGTTNGAYPYGSFVQASNGKLYGMTNQGGTYDYGVLFSFDPSSNSYSKLLEFDGILAGYPSGDLIQASNGKLYGMTQYGGVDFNGVLFSFNISSNSFSPLLDFSGSTNGSSPYGSLMQASNGKLYGLTQTGGTNDKGVVFNFDPSSNVYTKLRNLNPPDGINPYFSNFIEVGMAISIGSIASSLCAGGGLIVPYTVTSNYNAGNVFTAQLSNASGSFASPINIGTISSTTSGSINATIPSNTGSGTGYRIRVISNNPAITGTDNGSNISITAAGVLNLKFLIQGYYVGGGMMQQVLYNQLVETNSASTNVDTVLIELRSAVNPTSVVASYQGILQTSGSLTLTLPCSLVGNSYYIVAKHRNTVQTWSALPVAISQTTSYDFTTAITKAYENNMIQLETGIWAFYSGDLDQDENVDLLDFATLNFGIVHGLLGYLTSDLNGDGNVDILDYPTYMSNELIGVYSHHP